MRILAFCVISLVLVACVPPALQRRVDDTRAEIRDLENRLGRAEDDETVARLTQRLEVATARLDEQNTQVTEARLSYVSEFATKAGGITEMLGGIMKGFNPAIGSILSVLGLGFGAFGGAIARKNGVTA